MDHIVQVTDQLASLLSENEQFPEFLYLFGQKSVGKSFCLQKFLDSRSWIRSVSVHTIECYTNKILFEKIINAFNDYELSPENDFAPFAKTDSMEDFLHQLSLMDAEMSYLIVIEEAEKLRNMDFNIMPIFTKLQEFTGLNITCVFVSHVPSNKLGIHSTWVGIHVPDFTKNDLIDVFSSKYAEIQKRIAKAITINREIDEDERNRQLEVVELMTVDFYKNFLNISLNVFYKNCRDITELESLTNKCYKSYYAPVISGEIKHSDVTNLWRNITKHLKVALQNSHIRVENSTAIDLSQKLNIEPSLEPVKENSLRGFAQTLELPNYAKYLLIASFLASHNDAKFDRRLFMKHHGKEKKRQHPKAKVSEKMNVQFGPKSFTIDRLLAIFYAILEEKVGLTCNLLSQISTLVDLNFLNFVSGESNIMEGTARLQSTIGMEFAINIGRLVGFNVRQYLTDFH